MTYNVIRGVSYGDKHWPEGEKISDGAAPKKAINDWLKIGAIKRV